VLNFDSADVETVVHAASEVLGFNYVIAPDVRGKVTVQTSGRIPQEDVFNVLLAVLEVHGFTAVKTGTLYKIVRIPDAATRAVPTVVGTTLEPARDPDEILTQIVPVRFTNVNDLRTLLQPLVSPQRGSLIAHRETNILILTDTASNIRRLLDIVRLVDVEVALEEIQIIPLQFADAGELAQILTQLFASGRLRPAGAPAAAPVSAPAPGAPAAPAPRAPGAAAERPPLILAERRSNVLVVNARRNELETIKSLIARLDVNITGGRRIFIYFAENAKAKDLAATMNAIYGKETGAASTAPATLRQAAGEPRQPPTGTVYAPTAPPPPPPGAASGTGVAEASLVEGQFRFIADEATNSIILATYPRFWSEFEQTLRQLDRSPRQVLVEVLVAEITLTDETKLGIEWAVREGRFDFSNAPGLGTNAAGTLQGRPTFKIPTAATAGATTAISTLAGFNLFTLATDRFFAALNAFAAANLANVLSSPSIMTSENKKAVINVSDSIPIVTSQQVPIGGTTTPTAANTTSVIGTQSVEYRDAGVILTVTPRIGERGTVALEVKQEVNDVGDPEPPTGSRRIIKREAETSVVLLNNQTLVLGGLIRDRRGKVERGIPVLQDIPILGYFFGAKTHTLQKTELLILITPRVIGTALDAATVTDAMRKASPQIEESLKKGVRLPPTSPGAPPPPPPAPAAPPLLPLPQSAPPPAPGSSVAPGITAPPEPVAPAPPAAAAPVPAPPAGQQ
jgi:general secretion pathway protein D